MRPFFLLLGMILHESQPKSICLEAVICTYGQIFAVCQNNWTITLANLRLVWQLTLFFNIFQPSIAKANAVPHTDHPRGRQFPPACGSPQGPAAPTSMRITPGAGSSHQHTDHPRGLQPWQPFVALAVLRKNKKKINNGRTGQKYQP